MVLPAREDGRTHDRHEAGNRRLERRGISGDDGRQTAVSGSVADPRPPLVANPLAAHYSRFRVTERILLTGHSHQAWPDVAFEAQQRAWLDAAELVDAKWDLVFAQAARVRAGFARVLGDAD